MKSVYINSLGTFLPGPPLDGEAAEKTLGLVTPASSVIRRKVMRQNRIGTRHYALDGEGRPTHRNDEMAAQAIQAALALSPVDRTQIDYLAAATTQGDLFVPGFASMVQAAARIKSCDIASFQGVCASSVAALQSAFHAIGCGRHRTSVVSGSDFPSRLFRSENMKALKDVSEGKGLPPDMEFLRWMLSDGAGAAVLRDAPNPSGLSLRVDWMEIKSYADNMPVCMYAGGRRADNGQMEETFGEAPHFADMVERGMMALRQDFSILDRIVAVGVEHYLELIQRGKLAANFDWFLCHYSSHVFKGQIEELLRSCHADIPEEKWFTNLYSKGNTGAASILIMLDELWRSGRLKPGQTLLCQVPESGRFLSSFIHLTVVGQEIRDAGIQSAPVVAVAEPTQTVEEDSLASLLRQLFGVWGTFERDLRQLTLVQRIESGRVTRQDYLNLLLNLRQQVMEGSRWIAKAASQITEAHLELRSKFIKHAMDEHRDYKMLEANYVAAGGDAATIQSFPKNIGSEAFSSYMFHQAGCENPFHLVGSMFIIEGLGKNVARGWGEKIQRALQLPDEAVSFLVYHGKNDEAHIHEMMEAFQGLDLTPSLVRNIVHTAKTTARLYRLQLEEIGNI
jgi:3-oxoacyl-[acyl-carrier-protein] synthase III